MTGDNDNVRSLGAGFNSGKQVLYQACVDNAQDLGEVSALTPITEGSLELKLESDQRNVQDALGISADGRYTTGAMTMKAAASYMKTSESDAYNIAYNYIGELRYVETMEPSRKNPIRPLQGHVDELKRVDKAGIAWDFYKICGDEYVWLRKHAARLLMNINISFVSETQKETFKAHFGVSAPAAEFNADFLKDHKELSVKNQMTVVVQQVGGDPSYIGQALCPTYVDGTKKDPGCGQNSQVIVNCAFGKLSDCVKTISGAIAYANKEDTDGFYTQLHDFKKYAVVSLSTSPYQLLGKPFTAAPPNQMDKTFFDAVDRVVKTFDSAYKNYRLAYNFYYGEAPRLSSDEKDEMEKQMQAMEKTTNGLVDAIASCYGDNGYRKCLENRDNLPKLAGAQGSETLAQGHDRQYKAIMALTAAKEFVQYCDIADAKNPDIKLTMDTLSAYAIFKKAGNLQDGDYCYNLATWYKNQTAIDLSEMKDPVVLGDLAPLGTLKNLTSLKIANTGIRSINALAPLVNLTELNVSENKIDDLSAVLGMKVLNTLNVSNNKIGNATFAKLAALSGVLNEINATGNDPGLQCPMTDKSTCQILSFKDYADISSANTPCELTMQHQSIGIDQTHILATGGIAFPHRSNKMALVDNKGCITLPTTLKVARMGHTMTSTPRGILVIGGGTNKIELIDPKTYETTILSKPLRDIVTQHSATQFPDGSILVVGGATDANAYVAITRPTGLSSAVQLVDPSGDVKFIGNLYMPRSNHTATLLADGRVLILGGYSLNKMVDIAEVIDLKNQSNPIQMLPKLLSTGRAGHIASRLENGHVFIAGGAMWQDENGGKTNSSLKPLDSMLDFDPVTNEFRELKGKLNPARTQIQSVDTSDHRVLLFGGLEEAKPITGNQTLKMRTASKKIQVFDPTSEKVYDVGVSMLDELIGFTVTPVSANQVLIFGGQAALSVKDGAPEMNPLASAVELFVYRPR